MRVLLLQFLLRIRGGWDDHLAMGGWTTMEDRISVRVGGRPVDCREFLCNCVRLVVQSFIKHDDDS